MSENETTTTEATPRVIALVATIPARRKSCERLLAELARQSRPPDAVVLILDGHGAAPAPTCSLPVLLERRTEKLSGAGQRWLVAGDLPPDDIVICLDDDIVIAQTPQLIRKLVDAMESGAAAAMGRSADGKAAPPQSVSRGNLIYGAGCSFTMRAKHLVGLQAFADEVVAAGGSDALGVLGDDDALVSAYLWRQGIVIHHAATGNIYPAPSTRSVSQTAARAKRREDQDAQKRTIARITGWPWRGQQGAIRAAR